MAGHHPERQIGDSTSIDGRTRWPRGRRRMSLGLMVPISEQHAFGAAAPRFQDMLEIVKVADAVGFDVAWFADHLILGGGTFNSQVPGGMVPATSPVPVRGVWECWTMMAGIAAATERIHVGSLVVCTGFRNPALLGAGWHKPEYDMFGYPYDHRASRFEEALSILHPLLRGESVTFNGEFEQAEACVNKPVGPRPGGIPILVGTNGPRMLRLTARYADAWNTVWHKDPTVIPPLLEKVDAVCDEVGRDPASLVRTAGANFALSGYLGARPDPIEGDAAALAERLGEFAALGLSHFVCGLDPCTPASVEEFGRVIELLGD
jgi:alkanesulfonate monooxygenase SsuD/methylene tetrahydromethanopterin reductase-like flavin-dependent oxidoreductase (luciferase family)